MKDREEIKQKLQAAVTTGNLTEIALREVLSSYFSKKRVEKMNSLVMDFNGKKTLDEMLPGIASLAALVEMENDLMGQVIKKNLAHKRIGELENEGRNEPPREY